MKKLLYISIFLLANLLSAQQEIALFEKANKLYQEDKLEDALTIYKQIETQKLQSDDLYYNMGNVYYKLNQIAPAVYYFEKALVLNPNNADAAHNLMFANRMKIDNIEALPKTIGERFSESFIQKLTYNTWAWLAVILAFLFAVLFLLYHFSYNSSKKRLFFITSLISAALSLLLIVFAYSNYNYVKNNKYAIVFEQQVSVKSEPKQTADISFELHEGTKVKLLESVPNWEKIKLADGKIGWVQSGFIKKID